MIARRRMLEIAAGCAAVFSLGGAGTGGDAAAHPSANGRAVLSFVDPRRFRTTIWCGSPDTPARRKARSPTSAGYILESNGQPLSGMRVEIWQCDTNGRYHYVRDGRAETPLDDDFQGYGQTTTDGAGSYRFRTIRPVPYPGRTPHIHFTVSGPGLAPFTTQMYIAGEPLNERDGVLMGVRDPAARARLIVPLRPVPEIEPNALAAAFDIVLG